MAAVLEAARIVDVDLHSPAKVRLRKNIADRGRQPLEDDSITETSFADPFSRIFGALKGTITIAPGTDLTAPTGKEWGAAR